NHSYLPKSQTGKKKPALLPEQNRWHLFSHYSIYFQATSGLRTIQMSASPVIAPATSPVVTAFTVVPTAGAMTGSRSKARVPRLTQYPTAQARALAATHVNI